MVFDAAQFFENLEVPRNEKEARFLEFHKNNPDEKFVYVLQHPPENINILGLKTKMELEGVPCYKLENNFRERKSCCVSKSFGKRITLLKDMRESVLEKSLKLDLSFRDSFLEGVFTVPGDCCINYNPLIKILYENEYSDWLVVEAEQNPSKANPYEYAKKGYNYLKKVITKNGYEI